MHRTDETIAQMNRVFERIEDGSANGATAIDLIESLLQESMMRIQNVRIGRALELMHRPRPVD